MYDTKLFDLGTIMSNVSAWSNTSSGIKAIKGAGLALQITGGLITTTGVVLQMVGNAKHRNLIISEESSGFDKAFCNAAVEYLNSSSRLVNREEIRGVVKEELTSMSKEDLMHIWRASNNG